MAQISASQCLDLLTALEVGSPVAEDDALLYESRVETAVFSELYLDRIDIVRGTKGSGKTALYRLLHEYLAPGLFESRRLLILKGVETKGDPVFLRFRPQFDQLSEIQFENFWRIYFISIVTSQLFGRAEHRGLIASAASEFERFKKIAREHGFPIKEEAFTITSLVAWALGRIPRVRRVEAALGPEGMPVVGFELEGKALPEQTPVFVSAIHEALVRALEKANLRLWITLDRLDEAFPRRSAVEKTALRALLRSTLAFKSERMRLKVFLRDDILSSVTDVEEGFVALTHVMARCSDVLMWSREQILQLITKRIFAEQSYPARFFKIDRERLEKDPKYRLDCFYLIFPPSLRAGKRQSSTLDWLYKHCEDANGVITPRDVIDLINFAKHDQYDLVSATREPVPSILSPAAVLQGHRRMSANKRDNYLKAEFPHFWGAMQRFQGQKAEHNENSLRVLLGEDFGQVKDLIAVGFLKPSPKSKTFSVPFIYRPGLGIRQGKSLGPENGRPARVGAGE